MARAVILLLFLSVISSPISANKCTNEHDESHPSKVVFFHTKKCGGWAIAHYFRFFNAQVMNGCVADDKTDWRCDMKFLHDTGPEEQCRAFNKFAKSK